MSKGEKDLFHGQGNSTVALPKHVVGKPVLTNPHATPGVKQKTKKVILKGWSK